MLALQLSSITLMLRDGEVNIEQNRTEEMGSSNDTLARMQLLEPHKYTEPQMRKGPL